MSLKEILQKIVTEKNVIILNDGTREWEAGTLLDSLSEPRLNVKAHFQPGMYIAEVDPRGYMGRVLYRVNQIN